MAATAILYFQKFDSERSLLCRGLTGLILPNFIKICRGCGYWPFSGYLKAAVRHLRLKIQFLTAGMAEMPILHQYAKFPEDRSNRCWDIAIFVFFKMEPDPILDFPKFEFLKVASLYGANMRHRAKFYLKNLSSAILDLLDAYLDHPQRVLGSLYSRAKFG